MLMLIPYLYISLFSVLSRAFHRSPMKMVDDQLKIRAHAEVSLRLALNEP